MNFFYSYSIFILSAIIDIFQKCYIWFAVVYGSRNVSTIKCHKIIILRQTLILIYYFIIIGITLAWSLYQQNVFVQYIMYYIVNNFLNFKLLNKNYGVESIIYFCMGIALVHFILFLPVLINLVLYYSYLIIIKHAHCSLFLARKNAKI